jgi:hypothetical protein
MCIINILLYISFKYIAHYSSFLYNRLAPLDIILVVINKIFLFSLLIILSMSQIHYSSSSLSPAWNFPIVINRRNPGLNFLCIIRVICTYIFFLYSNSYSSLLHFIFISSWFALRIRPNLSTVKQKLWNVHLLH